MVVILLCAGFGTRLYPMTKNRPNALLDVAGKPVVDYQMEQLLELPGLTAIHVVANGRFASDFYRWWLQWRPRCDERNVMLELHVDGSVDSEHRLGEVGDLAFVLRRIDTSRGAVVSAGDNVYRFLVRPLWDRFVETGENIVLAFPESHHQVLQQHAVVEFDADMHVVRVHDQPDEPPSQWVCPNLYFLQDGALDLVEEFLLQSGERDRLAQFLDYLAERRPVRVVTMPSGHLRLHVNTRYMYEKANDVLAHDEVLVADAFRGASIG